MALHSPCCLLALALFTGASAFAQTSIRTETIRPPPASLSPSPATGPSADRGVAAAGKPTGHLAALAANSEIINDLSRLPPAVASTRERILTAARSGDLRKLVAVMQASGTMPVFAFSDDKDPIVFWKANYPDSEGIEVLSILITILETGFVRIDEGKPQEMYVWPYFVRMPLKTLSLPQRAELFRIVTGADYKDMVEFGSYAFYRLGIGPDGSWHFFVAGD